MDAGRESSSSPAPSSVSTVPTIPTPPASAVSTGSHGQGRKSPWSEVDGVAKGPGSALVHDNTPSTPATQQQTAWTPAHLPSITTRPPSPPESAASTHVFKAITDSTLQAEHAPYALDTVVEVKDGRASSSKHDVSFIMVQKKASGNNINGVKRDQSTMSFSKKDGADARGMGGASGKGDGKAQNGNASGFRTDNAISSGRPGTERTLQRWLPDGPDDTDFTLEKPSSSGGQWDQFAENERLFGLKTDYDENYYTTQIDKSHPKFQQRMAAADKKAREIEKSAPTTAHVAEERQMDYTGGTDDKGGDEEDKYSGVKRQEFPPLPGSRENKYTPPARRAPTANATVKGAPVDPAIISSQLKAPKAPAPAKAEEPKGKKTPPVETQTPPAPTPTGTAEPKSEAQTETQPKSADSKTAGQSSAATRPSAPSSRTMSPQTKESAAGSSNAAAAPATSATSTVERDVLKEFKSFANQQRLNAEKVRSSKAKADKEVKLTELKKFADSFKLPTPVPQDLIGIIAKDPQRQREIQEKAKKDAAELAKRKTDEAAAKTKKETATKDGQNNANAPAPADTRTTRQGSATATTNAAVPSAAPARHPQGGRQNFVPNNQQYRPNAQHMPQANRQTAGLGQRIRNIEQQKMQPMGQEVRLPPTGPANAADPSFRARLSGVPNHVGGKLNPNSHEFRPSTFAPSFTPNGHPSAGSSPRSAANNTTSSDTRPSAGSTSLVIVSKKRKNISSDKCVVFTHLKSIHPQQGKSAWEDNDGVRFPFDTPPTWRQPQDTEPAESTMRLTYTEYFEKQPFATQPTPNLPHVMPQLAHQHQLPFHLQHGAANVGPRHSPHVPPVQMHGGQHGPGPHGPYNGADDHRMMHSNSSQSFSSPRMSQVPMAFPANMNSPAQMPYNQPVMQPFMGPGTPQMGQFRSFSNTPQYIPQQPGPMGGPMMMQPQFMAPQGMVAAAPQMQMYNGHPQFIPPGGTPPQPMPGTNGYPSPGRPAASMMVHQGSQQGQQMYGMSPGMAYQQPVFAPQQPGQMGNMRYSNAGPQQYGTSPQQMHQYAPQHRSGSNNFKGYQGHNQHQAPQNTHQVPTAPQGRTPDGADEAK